MGSVVSLLARFLHSLSFSLLLFNAWISLCSIAWNISAKYSFEILGGDGAGVDATGVFILDWEASQVEITN